MRMISILAGVVLVVQPVSVFAQGQGNQGQGNQGQGNQVQGNGQQVERGPQAQSNRGNGPANNQTPRMGAANAGRNAQPANENRGNGQPQRAQSEQGPGQGQGQGQNQRRAAQGDAAIPLPAQARRVSDRVMRTVEGGRYAWRSPGFEGCPPGLQQKNNGCLPPGQARKLSGSNDRDLRWYRYSDWFRTGGDRDWRYDRGYAYLVDPRTNLITSALPLLGGALFGGNSWPANYASYQLNPYQTNYYGSGSSYDYRVANGAVFAVDPETQLIQSIAGLITGDDWSVGSRMPPGYDVYNVPTGYRDRYSDNSSSLYRYNDGYVYEVDPTTQIVRSLIELVV